MLQPHDPAARTLAFSAALLFLLGALTGVPLALAQTGVVDGDAHTVLGAHLNAILGCFLLLGVAFSLRYAELSEGAQRWLVRLTVVSTYANWLVTLVKAFLHVKGVSFNGDAANDSVAVALNVLVVFPTLAGAALWCWGLRRMAPQPERVAGGSPNSGEPSRRAT